MNKAELGKIMGAATMFYFAIAFSGGLQAAMISGQFSLIQDEGENRGIMQGDLVASVTFTAEDTFTTNDDDLSIFNVTRLQVIDRTPDLNLDNSVDGSPDGISLIGNFLYDAGSTAGTSTISTVFHALYDPFKANAFVGIDGTIMEYDPMIRVVTFMVEGNTLLTSTAGNFNMNVENGFIGSYAQVPEPNALALLGIGLVGFGMVRLRELRG